MNEAIQKRLQKLEWQAKPDLRETFPIIETIRQVGIEFHRLESLSPFEAELEMSKPLDPKDPKALILKAARTGYRNRDNRTGMIPSSEPIQTPENLSITRLMMERRRQTK